MSGGLDVGRLGGAMAAARGAAEGIAGRPMAGLRVVSPGTGGRAWLVAFTGPGFLCLDEDLCPVASLTRVRDVAQASLALEVVEDALDAAALRAVRPHVEMLAPWHGQLPAATGALGRAAAAADALADWRESPTRIVASLVELDRAVGLQGRAHAAYATFVGVTEPLVARQADLDDDLLAALAGVERVAGNAGLGTSLAAMIGEGMGGIIAAADEVAAAHLTPLR